MTTIYCNNVVIISRRGPESTEFFNFKRYIILRALCPSAGDSYSSGCSSGCSGSSPRMVAKSSR